MAQIQMPFWTYEKKNPNVQDYFLYHETLSVQKPLFT